MLKHGCTFTYHMCDDTAYGIGTALTLRNVHTARGIIVFETDAGPRITSLAVKASVESCDAQPYDSVETWQEYGGKSK